MPDSPRTGIRLLLPALAALLLVSLIWTPGCDSGDPDDTLGLITRIQLSLASAEPPLSATASVRGVDGLGTGATIVTDTLLLQLGVTYEGTIRLFGAGDRDVTSTVENEAENYQIFYTIEGATGVAVTVTDVESDYGPNTFGEDLRVGLAFRVIVSENAPAEGRIRVRAGEFPQGRKNGLTLTVEPVVDVVVPFRVGSGAPLAGPGATETITRAELSLERIDGTHTWTINAESAGGLNLGPNEVPGSLAIESCETDNGAVTCTDRDTLVLRPGIYQGSWDLHDGEGLLNDEIAEEAVWHRFFHTVNFGDAFSDYDLDGSGLPLGLRFRMDAPEGVIIGSGSFGVRLGHFNPDAGEVKGEENEPAAFDMQYRIPMQLHQNGPPELLTRAVLVLRRADGMETVTVTAVADNLQLRGAEPGSLVVETCTGPTGQEVCTTGAVLSLSRAAVYSGTLEVFDDDSGDDVMAEILAEDTWHRFYYSTTAPVTIDVTDTDGEGLPLGFAVQVTTVDVAADASLRITLDHYGRFGFKVLGRSVESDMDFSVPLVVP